MNAIIETLLDPRELNNNTHTAQEESQANSTYIFSRYPSSFDSVCCLFEAFASKEGSSTSTKIDSLMLKAIPQYVLFLRWNFNELKLYLRLCLLSSSLSMGCIHNKNNATTSNMVEEVGSRLSKGEGETLF